MNEKNAGYEIQEKISLQHGTFVLGHNPNAPAPWVTWEHVTLKGASSSYYHHGNYFTDEASARLNLLQRAIACLPREQSDALALAVLSDEAKEDLLRQDREGSAWEDIQFCFYDAAEYLKIPDTAASRLLNDPQFRSEALRVFWNQDHSYANEALQESLEILIRDRFADKLALSHEEIFEEVANRLDTELLNGEAGSSIDVCVEMPMNQKGYLMVVWGEENDAEDKFYSVSVYTTDRDGYQDVQLINCFSDSDSMEDLKVTVLDVLDQFEGKLARDAEKGMTTHESLADQIQGAESRQGRGGAGMHSKDQDLSH